MEIKETEKSTAVIMERMETSMSQMEQMSFDSINITDKLVTLTSQAREHASAMKSGTAEQREAEYEVIGDILNKILETAFTVNNVSHDLEKEVVYQRDTADSIKEIIDFLYAMVDV